MALKGAAAGLALVLSATQAVALSCIEPDVERSFNRWVDSEDTYYIGVGSLKPLDALQKIPNRFLTQGSNDNDTPITARYQFSGELLDGERGHPADLQITVNITCAGPWCGGFPKEGESGLMALRGTGILNLTLDMHACPGSIFPAGTKGRIQQCIRDGRCNG